jgi:hypothetical protein
VIEADVLKSGADALDEVGLGDGGQGKISVTILGAMAVVP